MTDRRLVGLLRAVNVGGRSLPMADLRSICAELGCSDVVTYVQSGNVVVTTSLTPRALARDLTAAITAHAGFDVPVMVRDHRQLVDVLADNPYRDSEPRFVHVGFLDRAPSAKAIADLGDVDVAPEAFTIDGPHLYLDFVNGAGRSEKLAKIRFERRLGVAMTARNLNTVAKLADLAEG